MICNFLILKFSDGTLFLTPDKEEGKKFYFQKTGKNWDSLKKKGWWNLSETLEHPFEIRVGPAYVPFVESSLKKDCLLIIVRVFKLNFR